MSGKQTWIAESALAPDFKSSALSLDFFLFAPIAQMGPLRLQVETYAKWLVWDINQVIWTQSTCSDHVLFCFRIGQTFWRRGVLTAL